jgi:hypothetical protein
LPIAALIRWGNLPPLDADLLRIYPIQVGGKAGHCRESIAKAIEN